MKPKHCLNANTVAGIALIVALAVLTAGSLISCEYFDPLDPLSRRPGDSGSANTWSKVILPTSGGTGNGDEGGTCIQQTEDQGFIIAGYVEPKVGVHYDAWLVKTDSFGNVEWDKTYGEIGNERFFYVEQTADGGYIAVGYKEIDRGGGTWDADLWLLKVKPDDQGEGEMDWERLYGEAGTDEAGNCVRCAEDGGYIITGEKMDSGLGFECLWLLKTDAEGNLDPDWTTNPKAFSGTGAIVGECVSQTEPDGGYVVAGVTSAHPAEDAYIIKTDDTGLLDTSWASNPHTFGATEEPDFAYCVQQTSDGGYILSGETRSFGAAGMDALIIKLDASGNLDSQWATNPQALHIAFDTAGNDRANCVQQTSDGGYIFAGMTHYEDQDAWLVKLDASGDMQWDECFGGAGHDEAKSVRQTADGGYILAGITNSYPGGFNLYLVYYKP
jgi:hypothetical protein